MRLFYQLRKKRRLWGCQILMLLGLFVPSAHGQDGGLNSIGVSYSVYNSVFTHNTAIGYGANPQRPDTPGGGSGGAIYNDGNDFDLNICGIRIENNSAREGSGAVFFVSNNRTGHLIIRDSTLRNNPSDNFENYPGIFYLSEGDPQFINSTIE